MAAPVDPNGYKRVRMMLVISRIPYLARDPEGFMTSSRLVTVFALCAALMQKSET